jgi:hypothetical protein
MKSHRFEVGIFNQQVVEAMRTGGRHRSLKDSWGEKNYFTVDAKDATEARRKMEIKYPPDLGFVIDSITQTDD